MKIEFKMFKRAIQGPIEKVLSFGKSVLLLGARQTGKTTLAQSFNPDVSFNFADSAIRQTYERNPSQFLGMVRAMAGQDKKPLIFLDEIQKVPFLMDLVQILIDEGTAQFILTGSSARKLRHGAHINLLPGRVVQWLLEPLRLDEILPQTYSIERYLSFGMLPSSLTIDDEEMRIWLLKTYVETYIEEEVRQEALVRNLKNFIRFVELSSNESGMIVNLTKLSQEIGVAHTTISQYYEILEDCLIAHRIEAFTKTKTRRRLLRSPKYLFFDLGVRRFAAQEKMPSNEHHLGRLFEQFVGLELLKYIHAEPEQQAKLYFWRDASGIEVDYILCIGEKIIPIEVKWTDNIREADTKHLRVFLKDYPDVQLVFVIAKVDKPILLSDKIMALPWMEIKSVWEKAKNMA